MREAQCMITRRKHEPHVWYYTSSGGGHMLDQPDETEKGFPQPPLQCWGILETEEIPVTRPREPKPKQYAARAADGTLYGPFGEAEAEVWRKALATDGAAKGWAVVEYIEPQPAEMIKRGTVWFDMLYNADVILSKALPDGRMTNVQAVNVSKDVAYRVQSKPVYNGTQIVAFEVYSWERTGGRSPE